MTQTLAPPCPRCGVPLHPYASTCPNCGALAHRAELERLSQEAMALEAHDPAAAIDRWQRCLQLLPPQSQQYAAIYYRLSVLAARFHSSGFQPTALVAPPTDTTASALLKTGGSMVFSILIYAVLFTAYFRGNLIAGAIFATGFVVLILVHELGHVAAMRHYGLSASPPIFIPFLGAVINLRQQPPDAKVEAVVGIGGPLAGTLGAFACYGVYLAMPDGTRAKEVTELLSFFGFVLNWFNLLPVPPLDGGRITAAVSPKLWIVGIVVLIGYIVHLFREGSTPVLPILILLVALPRVLTTLSRRSAKDPYYSISKTAAWIIGTLYVALALLLTWMVRGPMGYMWSMLSQPG